MSYMAVRFLNEFLLSQKRSWKIRLLESQMHKVIMSAFTKDQLGEPCVVALHRGFESANGTEPDTSLCDIPPLSADITRHPFSKERAAR